MDYHTTFASAHDLLSAAPREPVKSADVIWGSPVTKTHELFTEDGPLEVGIWQLQGGACRDIEVEELFVVLSGRALLTVNGRPPREVAPGDLVKLEAGDVTTWVVQTTLRKLYLTPGAQ
ncbi:cupin domain-containing protein (plasmid) [Herbiconiux sp. KACC 21604]|uniref:cupin domain-containing protein n=1 Tax=unclassified Herbiconiux TaxID=2618217 RepID=UPI00149227DB|nr:MULTISPECIES: cupin domain-containing protein [unclassified Herbiconiux]QJU56341.1 cupin domain-containing protein [Herbiconiux sp. SALV-R1]WPO88848.1 cupin domain-containing protein [Herbiconiux sp. KACC 21604]